MASKTVAAGLFAMLCLLLMPETFTRETNIYWGGIRVALLWLTGLNLLLCTLQRIRTLPKPVLAIHFGALIVLIGGVVSSLGFVATVNMYEGTSVDKVYRWDTKEEVPLGVEIGVKKVNMEYYPIALKVGVLKGNEKVGLFELKTGDSFAVGDYVIRADALELPSDILKLRVSDREGVIGSAETSGVKDLPANFPYDFVLVAFKNPSLKRMWLDLRLTKGPEIIAEGTSEVNSPFEWQGLTFYHTRVDRDKYGMSYAGLQVTRDPGRRYVYAGFIIMGLGSVLYVINFMRRLYGFKQY